MTDKYKFSVVRHLSQRLPDWSKNAISPTPPALGRIPSEFRRNLFNQKTTVPGLSYGIVCMILCLPVLIQHQLVMDRWTAMTANMMLA